jgi:hypothetical protein
VNQQEKVVVQPHRERIDDDMLAKFTVKNRELPLRGCVHGSQATEWQVALLGERTGRPFVISDTAWAAVIDLAKSYGFEMGTIGLSPVQAIAFVNALERGVQTYTGGMRDVVLRVIELCREGRGLTVERRRKE